MPDPGAMEDLDQELLLTFGEELGLLARVRAVTPRELLERDLRPETVEALDRGFYGAAASMLLHEEVCREIAGIADRMGLQLMFLKGVALHLLGVTIPGSRPVGDIDVLVSKDEARDFHQALLASGCTSPGFPGPDYHLPLIYHPRGSAIEVHHQLAGVRLTVGPHTALEHCLEADLCDQALGMPRCCLVPSEPLMVAHLLAHGLGAHGKTPELYPGLRFLADLQDLGYSPMGGKRLPVETFGWIAEDVSAEEAAAAVEVLALLEGGERGSQIVVSEEISGILLRHILACHLDGGYAKSLKLMRRLEAPASESWPLKLGKSVWRAIWLTPEQIEIVYGKPASWVGYLRWRLWRPFDLIGRALMALKAHWNVRNRH